MTSLQITMALNIGSLVLGAGAWILAILAIAAHRAAASHRDTILSFCFCALSLVLQLFEVGNRVSIGDHAAIEDTIRAVSIASVALIVVTAALNLTAWEKAKKK